MTLDERMAEVERLKKDHAEALSAPRMMDGNISPYQVSRMSERQKAKWQRLVSERFDIERQIKSLSRTDNEILADERKEQNKRDAGRVLQISSMIEIMQRFKGKNGKILPKYAREIEKLTRELEEL